MLKGIDPVVSPELLKILAEMGHGDEIVFSDAHFPAHTIGVPVVRADGLRNAALLAGVLPLLELDSYVQDPVVMMAPVPGDSLDEELMASYRAVLKRFAPKAPAITHVERFAFYERAKKAYAVVVSGETAKYGNIILKKGVTPVA